MSQNEFVVTEIPGPHVMKKVCAELGYSKEQMKVIDALRPTHYPLYVYQNPDTRYWFGSNPSMMSGKPITWVSYLEDSVADPKMLVLVESDLAWLHGRFKDLKSKIKEMMGE